MCLLQKTGRKRQMRVKLLRLKKDFSYLFIPFWLEFECY
jgi:hypothetical protein